MYKVSNLADEEKKIQEESRIQFGEMLDITEELLDFSNHLIVGGNQSSQYIIATYHYMMKYFTLSTISFSRRHVLQAMLDKRMALEVASVLIYLMEHDDAEELFRLLDDGSLDTKYMQNAQNKKVYKWLENNHKEFSDVIKTTKDTINGFFAHGTIGQLPLNFDFESNTFTFFDDLTEKLGKIYLSNNANNILGINKIFFDLNDKNQKVNFREGFIESYNLLGKRYEEAVVSLEGL